MARGPRPRAWTWAPVLAWLAGIYLIVNLGLPNSLPAAYNVYLVQPLLWTSLGALSYLGWRFGLANRPRFGKAHLLLGVLVGVFQIAMLLAGGLLLGFGHSPYAHHGLALLGNALYLVSMLVGLELGRAYLMNLFAGVGLLRALIGISVLFTFLGIPVGQLSSVEDVPMLFRVAGETVLPSLSENLLASYLALIGGPLASLTYRLIPAAFEWLSPILPDLSWAMTAFIGTLSPAVGLLVIHGQTSREETGRGHEQGLGSWVVVALLTATLVWFNTGVFGIRPTIVSGVSMEPALVVGDLVITRDVAADDVQVGDVIRFRLGESYVLHRVIEVQEERGMLQFVTQGDANNVADSPVVASQVEGVVVLTIPYLGWVSIAARELVGRIPWPAG
jgi:signal peptidase